MERQGPKGKRGVVGGVRGRLWMLLLVAVLVGFGLGAAWSGMQQPEGSPARAKLMVKNRLEPPEFGEVDFTQPQCTKAATGENATDMYLYFSFWSNPGLMTNGVYLELGAFDGIRLSNTHWLDKCIGWKGLLIEGQPESGVRAKANRESKNTMVLRQAICEKEGTMEYLGGPVVHSGNIEFMTKRHKDVLFKGWNETRDQIQTVPCGPLSKALKENGIHHIDLWSLDVEGAELSVMNSFDWEEVTVHVLFIETLKNEKVDKPKRHALLRSKNFELRGRHMINEIWVNPANARPGMRERAHGKDFKGMHDKGFIKWLI